MSTPTYVELCQMSITQIVKEYDEAAIHQNGMTPSFCLDEIFRRQQIRQTEILLEYTVQIKWFTIIVAICTIISTLAVMISVFK